MTDVHGADLNELLSGSEKRETLREALFENIQWPTRVNGLPPEGVWAGYQVFVLSVLYGSVTTPEGENWMGGLALIAVQGRAAVHSFGDGRAYAHKVHNRTELGRCGLMIVALHEVRGLDWDAPAGRPKAWPKKEEGSQ